MGILKNTATGKYHPIAFRQNPMPGLADLEPGSSGHRYKSLGNDPIGYDTIEQARETVRDRQEHIIMTDRVWDWDPSVEEIPARVEFFKTNIFEEAIEGWEHKQDHAS
jgi:hypothetical protein